MRHLFVIGICVMLCVIFPGVLGSDWPMFGFDRQHGQNSPVGAVCLGEVKFSVPLNNDKKTGHFGSPLVTAANTVIVGVRSVYTGNIALRAYSSSGSLLWEVGTGYNFPLYPNGSAAFNWVPVYQPVFAGNSGPSQLVMFPGPGGSVYYRDNLDQPVATRSGQVFYYGNNIHDSNASSYDSAVYINSGLVVEGASTVLFTTRVTGTTPTNMVNELVRLNVLTSASVSRSAPNITGDTGLTTFPLNVSPAFSSDGSIMYLTVTDGTFTLGGVTAVIGVDPTTLQLVNDPVSSKPAIIRPRDPEFPTLYASITDDSSASPAVGPDGDVYFGMLGGQVGQGNMRYLGWTLHFDKYLQTTKIPGGFGWDDTASFVSSSLIPSYTGSSSYLLFQKYNDYPGINGGKGLHRLVLLDPNSGMADPAGSGVTVMNISLSVLSPTLTNFQSLYPNSRTEWCINAGVFDPQNVAGFADNEDGNLYRWDMKTNVLTQYIRMADPASEAYTPTLIGPDGSVFALNMGVLNVVTCTANSTTLFPTTPTTTTTTTASTTATNATTTTTTTTTLTSTTPTTTTTTTASTTATNATTSTSTTTPTTTSTTTTTTTPTTTTTSSTTATTSSSTSTGSTTSSSSSSTTGTPTSPIITSYNYGISIGRCIFQFSVVNKVLLGNLTCPSTGWVALGVGPSIFSDPLQSGDWINTDGNNVVDSWLQSAQSQVTPQSDVSQGGVNNVYNTFVVRRSSSMSMIFRRNMTTGDNRDAELSEAAASYIVAAFSSASTSFSFASNSSARATQSFTSAGVSVNWNSGYVQLYNNTLVLAHGVIMMIAFGVCFIVGICVGRFVPKTVESKWWIHLASNALGVILVCTAFGIAVQMITNSGQPQFNTGSRSGGAHQILGIIIFIFAILQGLGGVVTFATTKDKDASARLFPNQFHFWSGRLFVLMGCINCFVGLYEWNIAVGWIGLWGGWCVILVIVLFVLELVRISRVK